jgi:pimeloyl-ACP methyl ester carboxylesterase
MDRDRPVPLHPIRAQRGGSGEPVVLLLHGLGASCDVWQGLGEILAQRWAGSWAALDIPGHGGSARLPRYSIGTVAAAIAPHVGEDEQVVVVGHSLGGAVGLALGSGSFGLRGSAALGLGIKVAWTDAELAAGRERASRPAKWFPTREEAAQRHLRVAGLDGLVPPDAPWLEAGLVEKDGQWRLALDPAAFAVGAPNMPGLLAAARAAGTAVVLARGENDHLVTSAQLHALDAGAVDLPGLGHNAHVERPEAIWDLIEKLVSRIARSR